MRIAEDHWERYETMPAPARTRRRGRVATARSMVIVLGLACGAGLPRCEARNGCSAGCGIGPPTERAAIPPAAAAPRDAATLRRTAVLPTLDSPIPEGKNAIWEIGTPLAWKQTRKKLGLPLDPPGSGSAAALLARSPASAEDVDPRSLLLEFGRIGDGVRGRIRDGLRTRFPGYGPPRLPAVAGPYLSYAFLALAVPFTRPYEDQPHGLLFQGADGRRRFVKAFGLGNREEHGYLDVRRQVRILYHRHMDDSRHRDSDTVEFAVDLDRNGAPYQIVVAQIPRPATLEAGYRGVVAATASSEQWRRENKDAPRDTLQEASTLVVPNLDWDLFFRHRELERGATLHFESRIRFRLDRSGARLTTEDFEDALSAAPKFELRRPFLLYIRHRRAQRPCFAAWIENAELLQPLPGQVSAYADGFDLPLEADDYHPLPRPEPRRISTRPAPRRSKAKATRERFLRNPSDSVSGGLDASVVRSVIARNLRTVEECYLAAHARDENLLGTVSVAFRIAPSGRVSDVRAVSTLLDEEARRCMLREVWTWSFPRAVKATRVTHSFKLPFDCDALRLHDAHFRHASDWAR